MTFLEFQPSIALVMTTMCTQTSCTLDPGCTVEGLALYGPTKISIDGQVIIIVL